mgnify:FL=1
MLDCLQYMVLTMSHLKGGYKLSRGMTLIEITLVISVLVTLISASLYVVGGYKEWKLGSAAAVELRRVYNAQRTYLAENPTENATTLTASKVIPYLSDGATSLPTVENMDGIDLAIRVDVVPPIILDGAGSTYDPSGSSDDGLWDVGRY